MAIETTDKGKAEAFIKAEGEDARVEFIDNLMVVTHASSTLSIDEIKAAPWPTRPPTRPTSPGSATRTSRRSGSALRGSTRASDRLRTQAPSTPRPSTSPCSKACTVPPASR
nr:hypothetical protein [Tessaracoccus coleopterorum]